MELSRLPGYELIEEKRLEELNGTGYLLKHKKTGARVLAVENDDENKVFHIAFRTPPENDKGIPHITEHSVLCGSKKFPAKDPFVELAKGSLNTFLNAMTYPDKTVYPVASMNAKDLHNLMDVYLDAVFHPNIYIKDEIMQQEGWHYELDEKDELIYNGVVYNEMRGAYSSPDQQLFRLIQTSLLPEAPYGVDSGGDPEHIPELTQQEFIDFHKKYYHPSNSYIYLYGAVDFEKELNFIDEEYLSEYDYLEVDSEINKTQPFKEPVRVEECYSIAENDEEEDNTFLSYNVIVGDVDDLKQTTAFNILGQVLVDMPGAPLKKALIDAGIGKDVYSSFDDGIRQPLFSIVAQNANLSDEAEFVRIVEEELQKQVSNGIDKKAIKAALNLLEFKHKEANFGRFPKGLMYGLDTMNTWLYDDAKAFVALELNPVFAELKSLIDTGYYENLIDTGILKNNHKSKVVLIPERGLNAKKDAERKEKLATYKASLSAEEIEAIRANMEHLKAYQSEPSTPEELLTIPLLSIDDIGKKARELNNHESLIEQVKIVSHDVFTNGISYISLNFSIRDISIEDYPYISLLTDVFKYVDTDEHTYGEIASEINLYTGGIGFATIVSERVSADNSYEPQFMVSVKLLDENLDKGMDIMSELLFSSHIDDKKRLKEIVSETRTNMKNDLVSAGHQTSAARAVSYVTKSGRAKEALDGIDYYKFLSELDDHFEERADELCERLKTVLSKVLSRNSLTISYTSDKDPVKMLKDSVTKLSNRLSTRLDFDIEEPAEPEVKNEGFKTASQVQYVATAGNYRDKGLKYNGALNVLSIIFSYDYLWINVRVKGGAYGAMCGYGRTGNSYFTSYRDPNLMSTYEIYGKALDYVKGFDCDERDMTKYIIGAIAKLDTPLTPSAEGTVSYACYVTGVTEEDLQRERDEILACKASSIRELAPYVEAVTASGIICAIGDEKKIEEAKGSFKNIAEIK